MGTRRSQAGVAAGPSMRERRAKRRTWWIAGGVVAAVVAALVINAPSITAFLYAERFGRVVDALPPAPSFVAADRLLVVAPHPDDESLCCAGAIQQARRAGAQVFIVWLTSGDAFEFDAAVTERRLRPGDVGLRRLGERRVGEARAAARILGAPQDHLTFLGYPDAGLQRMFLDYYTRPYRSPTTGLSAVAYEGALSPGAAFTGENFLRDLRVVFDSVTPTVVLAPSPEDRHPDHRTAGDAVLRLLWDLQAAGVTPPRAGWWIVHGAVEWPLPKGLRPRLPLYPPPRGRGLPWERVDLTPDEVGVKREAVRAHRSQMEVEARFMDAFVRRNELMSLEPLPGFANHD